MKYSAQYHVSPATFHVISRKVEYLWDSVGHTHEIIKQLSCLMFTTVLYNGYMAYLHNISVPVDSFISDSSTKIGFEKCKQSFS